MSGGGSGTQQVTQTTQLPPQFQQAFGNILNQANALQPQPVMRTAQRTGSFDGYGNYTPGGTYQVPTGQFTGGVTSIVPELSPYTMQGVQTLAQGPDAQAVSLLRNTAAGNYLNSNPYTSAAPTTRNQFVGQTGIEGVTDAITQAATKAVSDRFSQAGRTGSPGEGLALAGEVSRQLAPYAFGANESAMNRNFASEESFLNRQLSSRENANQRGFASREAERSRQLSALSPLLNLNQQQGQNLLNAGGIMEEQQRQKMLEPFNLFNLRTDPLIRALGGAPTSTTTTQPVNRNIGAGILGGVATGAGLGMLGAAEGATGLAALGPWGIPLMIGGGLLGAL